METLDFMWITALMIVIIGTAYVLSWVVFLNYFQRKLEFHRTIVRDLSELSEGGVVENDQAQQKQ